MAGPANLRMAVVAPVDEFFASILSERGRLFAVTLGFVALMVPIVFLMGSLLSGSLRALAVETDRIQRFEPSTAPPVRSMIREIDELGRSVSTMRTVAETFSRFVPRRLVEQLIETGTPLQLGGTRREVTLFFSDIVNFTEITEKADPARVMQYTSRYFAAVSEEIMRQPARSTNSSAMRSWRYGTRRPTIRIMPSTPAPARSLFCAPTIAECRI